MSQPPHSDSTARPTTDDGPASNAAPTGLTHREQQRRRIVIAGLTAPTLMTLPSRRAWSAACSKSKLKKLSGALSAKKKVETNCDTIGCKKTFWKGQMWPMVNGGPEPNDTFEQWFPNFSEPMFESPPTPTLLQVLNGVDIREKDENEDDTVYKPIAGELKKLNEEAVAALCNAFYLNNMNFIVGFHCPGTSGYTDPPGTSPGEIAGIYTECVATLNKDAIKAAREFLEDENDALGGCPIK